VARTTITSYSGVFLPHGSNYGYDAPVTLLTSPNAPTPSPSPSSTVDFIVGLSNDWSSACFARACGQIKAPRNGQQEAKNVDVKDKNWKKIPAHKQQVKEYFDLFYYKQPQSSASSSSRILFFTFAQALPTVIQRLLEVNKDSWMDMITIIALPYEDTGLAKIGAKEESEAKQLNLSKDDYGIKKHLEAYRLYSSLLVPVK